MKITVWQRFTWIDMEPGAEYTGSSQGKKTRAYISVLEGEVKIRCGEEAYLVGKRMCFAWRWTGSTVTVTTRQNGSV